MSNRKTIDFDKFMSERNAETFDVVVFGKTYKCKKEIPAIVPLKMARAEQADPAESIKLVFSAAASLFGSEGVENMCADGITFNEMSQLVKKAFDLINGVDDDDEELQEVTDEDSHVVRKGVKSSKK